MPVPVPVVLDVPVVDVPFTGAPMVPPLPTAPGVVTGLGVTMGLVLPTEPGAPVAVPPPGLGTVVEVPPVPGTVTDVPPPVPRPWACAT
jgi:hypothetical protein